MSLAIFSDPHKPPDVAVVTIARFSMDLLKLQAREHVQWHLSSRLFCSGFRHRFPGLPGREVLDCDDSDVLSEVCRVCEDIQPWTFLVTKRYLPRADQHFIPHKGLVTPS